MTVIVKNSVFWNVMPFSMVEITNDSDETAASFFKAVHEGSCSTILWSSSKFTPDYMVLHLRTHFVNVDKCVINVSLHS
jgi:hypothetical protein